MRSATKILGSVFALALLVTGCSSSKSTVDPCAAVTCSGHGTCSGTTGTAVCTCDNGYIVSGLTCTLDTSFHQPANTVAINFSIDDTAGQTYQIGQLEWKGGFTYDSTDRTIVASGWLAPFPPLYDDGPWTAGGHEPIGSVAGDHIWGITVFLAKPAADVSFEYGAQDAESQGWIWTQPGGGNGHFTVHPTDTTVTAAGLTLPGFGNVDIKFELDTNNLLATSPATLGYTPGDTVTVKGSYGNWGEAPMTETSAGSGIFEFVLSENTGPGKALKHSGLVNVGDVSQFVFVLNTIEYKDPDNSNAAATSGVTVWTKKGSGDWVEGTIFLYSSYNNTTIVAHTAAVNFTVDDANGHTYLDGELQWKGNLALDPTTGLLISNPNWTAPFPVLYDDGPWTNGGHEPDGATAGDHIWGITAFAEVVSADANFEYGVIQMPDGGWLWTQPGGGNGTFTLPANSTATIDPLGLILPGFGTNDLRFTLDTNTMLTTSPAYIGYTAGDPVQVKGTFAAWALGDMTETSAGSGIFTLTLSDNVGPGKVFAHAGLLDPGQYEFVFELNTIEYKDPADVNHANAAASQGVTVEYSPDGGANWYPLTVEMYVGSYFNTAVTIPAP